ncbi:hypothetical protein KCP73_23035 [Salmonella enterica subsp. enterica]|nr:hypothetical protein KCP73_23035 [Salmonella enterica subsp. enterica]
MRIQEMLDASFLYYSVWKGEYRNRPANAGVCRQRVLHWFRTSFRWYKGAEKLEALYIYAEALRNTRERVLASVSWAQGYWAPKV